MEEDLPLEEGKEGAVTVDRVASSAEIDTKGAATLALDQEEEEQEVALAAIEENSADQAVVDLVPMMMIGRESVPCPR